MAPLPEPILSRLTVIRVPSLSRSDLAAVALSIYARANADRTLFFDADLDPEVLDRLLDLGPRAIRLTLEDAMVRAAADGRRALKPADLQAAGSAASVAPMGSSQGRR